MPIFDDPRKSLEQLQRQLLQEEEEAYEEEYLTEEEWLDEELAEAKALLANNYEEAEAPYRNFANGYGQYQQPRQYSDFEEDDEEELEESAPRGNGQLALTFVLLAGIVAVAVYWVAVLL